MLDLESELEELSKNLSPVAVVSSNLIFNQTKRNSFSEIEILACCPKNHAVQIQEREYIKTMVQLPIDKLKYLIPL